jgi:DNA repair protein RAD5
VGYLASEILSCLQWQFIGSTDPGDVGDAWDSSPVVALRRNNFNSSTRLDVLSEDFRRLRDQDLCFHAIVFSQFTSFLDLIEVVLRRDRLRSRASTVRWA